MRLMEVSMSEWSAAQVSEWVSLIELPDGCAETVQRFFSQESVNGKELLEFTAKTLRMSLRFGGVQEPESVTETILRQRDAAS